MNKNEIGIISITGNEIDITGIDRAELLAELHNGTQPVGLGLMHAIPDMTPKQAREDLDLMEGKFNFDYYFGRPLKVYIPEDEPNTLVGVRFYDRDAGQGKCAEIVASLRAKQAKTEATGELPNE